VCEVSEQAIDLTRPYSSTIDVLKPLDGEGMQCARGSILAADEPTDKEMIDRKFLLHQFEAYMEGKLHAAQKYIVPDKPVETGMSYVVKYWRLKTLMAFRISSGILQVSTGPARTIAPREHDLTLCHVQFNYYDHTKLILSDDGRTVTFIDSSYNIWTWHLAALVRLDISSAPDSRERRRMESAWKKLVYAR
jgi:polo-like kinase 1